MMYAGCTRPPPCLQGSSLETACTESHFLRQFSDE